MKNIKYLLLLMFTVTVIFSCNKDEEKETYGLSRITEYPVFTITGDGLLFHNLGISYTDPGATASANGVDAPVSVEIIGRYSGSSTSELPVDVADHYYVTYEATNADDLSVTAAREVLVANKGDLVNSIEGIYMTSVPDGARGTHTGYYTMIWEVATNVYEISHAHGGRYSDGRGYEDNYRFYGGTITVVDLPNNVFTATAGTTIGWGGAALPENIIVDPATKTITFSSTVFGAYTSDVTLVQVN